MVQEIYIIDDDESSLPIFRELFKEDAEFKFIGVKTEQIDIALKNIPFLIIINEDAIDRDVLEVCEKIRTDEDNKITPIIVVSSNSDRKHRLKVLDKSVEYYIKKPVDIDYLYYTIKNLNRLLSINRRISPLTGLPGNIQIHAELKKRLSKGDVYGFLKGDQIIEFTAQVITRCVHEMFLENSFIGHIGGDDFIAIVPTLEVDEICQTIIANFDKNVMKFFTEQDIEKGYIEVANRKGIIEQFALTSISIGVVIVEKGRFSNILEIGDVGAQVKHIAKSTMGSSYAIDRRQSY